MASAFDVAAARTHFPALHQQQVFFDNAGGSQVLGEVIDAIRDYLSKSNVQLGASYQVGEQSSAAYRAGYAAAAKYVNAGTDEIVLGASTTQLFRNLSYALAPSFPPDSELILSKLDHEANIASWVSLAERHHLTIKWWVPSAVSNNPKLEPADLKALMTPRTRFVACTHTSNILGSITDIRAIADVVHEVKGALLCVDGVAYAPHRQPDVEALDVDFYSFSWYKVYGPHISQLYASPRARPLLASLGHHFNPSTTLADKLALAASTYELTASIPTLTSYFGPDPQRWWRGIAAHEETLAGVLLAYLGSRKDVTVFGEPTADSAKRVPTVSFVVEGWSPQELVETMEQRSTFGFRWGAFYSNRLVEQVLGRGAEGIVRVSMVHYNTVEEIELFVKTLDEVLGAAKS
ncbi:hypothetical protein B0A49_07689 [Cryomyces minteri]|uniref:Aminotransferase class V domain-containing protein n=2 Tax=Cryomyces minteri TaxID=331657 RepID=A0A4U0WPV1_9PEZI|nr:hypothetical protein B0A49_07689 [Cryomyces minteri]